MAAMIRRELDLSVEEVHTRRHYRKYAQIVLEYYRDIPYVPRAGKNLFGYSYLQGESVCHGSNAHFSLFSCQINSGYYDPVSFTTTLDYLDAELITAFYLPAAFTATFYCGEKHLLSLPAKGDESLELPLENPLELSLELSLEEDLAHLEHTLHISRNLPLPINYHQQAEIVIGGITYYRRVIFQPAYPLDHLDLSITMPRAIPFFVELADCNFKPCLDPIFWIESESRLGLVDRDKLTLNNSTTTDSTPLEDPLDEELFYET